MVTRPNYLAAQAWGIHPKSVRRRRRAVLRYLGPTLVYLAMIAIGALLVPVPRHIDYATQPNIDHGADWFHYFLGLLIVSWGLGFIACLILPFRMENRTGNARLLQANFHDYRLTSLSGREILTGLAAPQLASNKLWFFERIRG